jgi:hypothetical protein
MKDLEWLITRAKIISYGMMSSFSVALRLAEHNKLPYLTSNIFMC